MGEVIIKPNNVYLFGCISRSGLRLKGKKVFEEDDFCPAEAEEADEEKQEEEGESKEEEKEEKKAEEGGHVDTDEDCEVCPGTEALFY